jgi:serine phosphatase RsbU (regulator of sigma subunit)
MPSNARAAQGVATANGRKRNSQTGYFLRTTAEHARGVEIGPLEEGTRLTLFSRLRELPHRVARVKPETPGAVVLQQFDEYPDLAGVTVETDDNRLLGVVTRRSFFEELGRPFGVELFLQRAISTLLGERTEAFVLESDHLIEDAARQALQRAAISPYDPVVVHWPDGHHALVDMHDLLLAQSELLALSRQEIDQQLCEATDYVMRLLPEPLALPELRSEWRFIPSAELGGDMFGYHWLDEKRLLIYLADVSGHGIGQALLSVSVINLLQSQLMADVDDFACPEQVLKSVNRFVRRVRRGNMFVTMWYGVYDTAEGTIDYASAGHPPALLTGPDANLERLRTVGTALGILDAPSYSSATVRVQPGSRLYLYSDGVYEVTQENGKLWTLRQFQELVQAGRTPGLKEIDRIERGVRQVNTTEDFEDDFSLVVFETGPAAYPADLQTEAEEPAATRDAPGHSDTARTRLAQLLR